MTCNPESLEIQKRQRFGGHVGAPQTKQVNDILLFKFHQHGRHDVACKSSIFQDLPSYGTLFPKISASLSSTSTSNTDTIKPVFHFTISLAANEIFPQCHHFFQLSTNENGKKLCHRRNVSLAASEMVKWKTDLRLFHVTSKRALLDWNFKVRTFSKTNN